MEIDVETLFTHVDAGIKSRHRIIGHDLALHTGLAPLHLFRPNAKDGRIQLHHGSDPGVYDPVRPTAGGGHPRRSDGRDRTPLGLIRGGAGSARPSRSA